MVENAMRAEDIRALAVMNSRKWMDADISAIMIEIKRLAGDGKFKLDWDLSTTQTKEHYDRIKKDFSSLGFSVSSIHDTALEHGYSPTVTISW